jgi:hypothetical protein
MCNNNNRKRSKKTAPRAENNNRQKPKKHTKKDCVGSHPGSETTTTVCHTPCCFSVENSHTTEKRCAPVCPLPFRAFPNHHATRRFRFNGMQAAVVRTGCLTAARTV